MMKCSYFIVLGCFFVKEKLIIIKNLNCNKNNEKDGI